MSLFLRSNTAVSVAVACRCPSRAKRVPVAACSSRPRVSTPSDVVRCNSRPTTGLRPTKFAAGAALGSARVVALVARFPAPSCVASSSSSEFAATKLSQMLVSPTQWLGSRLRWRTTGSRRVAACCCAIFSTYAQKLQPSTSCAHFVGLRIATNPAAALTATAVSSKSAASRDIAKRRKLRTFRRSHRCR